ncbi:MAG: flagellar basal body P-ring protein FlgI [Deltaproteobacteria bacterium]|nr:flagellar basal body P-ring protein FlgI [Deltaproteobacteria bacterium]
MRKLIVILILLIGLVQPAFAVRIKDLVEIQGVRQNRLTGYGLIVGLNGTGDKVGSQFTILSLANMLRTMGIQVDVNALKLKNVAAVMVTSSLPPFCKSGHHLDCTVSSIGDATSLAGGTLISTPLYGPDGKVYALGQGPVSVGGFAIGGASGTGVTKNFPTVGRIPDGALVERSIEVSLESELTLIMDNPDFTTAHRLAHSINERFGLEIAKPQDLSTIKVAVPEQYSEKLVDFVSLVERVDIIPDSRAKVVVNERTGTVVMGDNVKISTVAIAHGNLSIRINEEPQVSQPTPFSQGVTTVTPQTGVSVEEGGRSLVVLPSGATIGELVSALNAIGVTPRDLVVILQCIKRADALHADLEVI